MKTYRFSLVLPVLLTLSAPARAELRCPAAAVELGEVKAGPPLTHRFRLVNDGKASVEILDARTTCGCLAPRLERRTLAPGEAYTFPVEVRTLGQAAGPHTWKAHVRYGSGAEARELPLEITATVVSEVVVQPAALTFFAQGNIRQEVTLTDLRPHPLSVTAVEASLPFLRATVTERGFDAAGRRLTRINLESTGELPDGRHEGLLSIYSDDTAYSCLQVPVTVVKNARAPVTAHPAEVNLSGTAGRPLTARLVRLRAADGTPVRVERITADDPGLNVTWAAGPEHFATVKVQADHTRLAAGAVRTAVHVHVASPVRETVTLPVSIHLE